MVTERDYIGDKEPAKPAPLKSILENASATLGYKS